MYTSNADSFKLLCKCSQERPIHAYGQVMRSSCPTTEKSGLTFLQPETGTPESSAQSSFQGEPPLQLKTPSYNAEP